MSDQKLSTKETIIQIAKFVAFSMGAGIIQIVSYTIIHELTDCAHWKAYLPSLILSVLYNFTVNRKFTFKSANNVPIAMLKVALFYCVFTPVSLYLGQMAENAGYIIAYAKEKNIPIREVKVLEVLEKGKHIL